MLKWKPGPSEHRSCLRIIKQPSSNIHNLDFNSKEMFNVPFKKTFSRKKVFMLRDMGKSKIHKLSLSRNSVSMKSLGIPLIDKLHMDSHGYKEGPVTQRNKDFDSVYKKRCTNILESL